MKQNEEIAWKEDDECAFLGASITDVYRIVSIRGSRAWIEGKTDSFQSIVRLDQIMKVPVKREREWQGEHYSDREYFEITISTCIEGNALSQEQKESALSVCLAALKSLDEKKTTESPTDSTVDSITNIANHDETDPDFIFFSHNRE